MKVSWGINKHRQSDSKPTEYIILYQLQLILKQVIVNRVLSRFEDAQYILILNLKSQ